MHWLNKTRVAEASRCLSLWLTLCDLEDSTGGTSLIKEKYQQVPPSKRKGRKGHTKRS